MGVCVYICCAQDHRFSSQYQEKEKRNQNYAQEGFITLRKLGAGEMAQQLEYLLLLQSTWGKLEKKD